MKRSTIDALFITLFALIIGLGMWQSCNRSHIPPGKPVKQEYKKGAETVKDTFHQKEQSFAGKPKVVYVDTGSVIIEGQPIDTFAVVMAYLQLDSIRHYADSIADSSAKCVVNTWVRGERIRQDMKMYWRERERSRVDTLFYWMPPLPPKFGHLYAGAGTLLSPSPRAAHGSASFITRNERVMYSLMYAPKIQGIQDSYIVGNVNFKIW